ncbi:MAG: hypothetical protein ABSB74_10225 [Tepidisphaeraceae bacterium]
MKLWQNFLVSAIAICIFVPGRADAYTFYSPADFYTGPILSTTNTLDFVLSSSYNFVLLGFESNFGDPNSLPFPYTTPVGSIMNVVAGGGYTALTNVYTGSTLNLNGGQTIGETDLFDNSTVNINSGSMNGNLNANSSSNVNVNGGLLGGALQTFDQSTAVMSNGEVGQLVAWDSSHITMSGGKVDNGVAATDNGVVNISGGTIFDGLVSTGGAITISGGAAVTGDVSSSNGGNIVVQMTYINGDLAADGGSIDFEGGTSGIARNVGVSGAEGISYLNGGIITGNVTVHGGGILNIGSGASLLGSVSVAETGSFVDMSGGCDIVENVNVSQGASLHIGNATLEKSLNIFDSSMVTMDGGFVGGSAFGANGGGVTVADQASFACNGGQIGTLEIDNTASAHLNGGVTGYITVNDSAQFFMSAGNAASLTLSTHSTAIVSSGQINAVSVANSSNFILAGGTIASLSTLNSSTTTITGGLVSQGITGSGNSTIDIESLQGLRSILGRITLFDNAKVLVEGIPVVTTPSNQYALSAKFADDISTPLSIYLNDNASLEIDGMNLTASLLDPDNGGTFSEYQLNGSLQDGSVLPDNFLLYVENGSGASFQLVAVPEPTSASLALLCGAAVLRRRPSRRRGHIVSDAPTASFFIRDIDRHLFP